MSAGAFLAIALLSLMAAVSPGPAVLMAARTGVTEGMRTGAFLAAGIGAGAVVWASAALFGLTLLFQLAPALLLGLKIAGGAYLLWMAWAVLKDRGGLSIRPSALEPPGRLVWRGILLNILNPKLPLFFMAFIPQFMPPGSGLPKLLELGAGFTAMTFAVFMGYVLLAATGRQRLLSSEAAMAWMRRAFAASFALLGLKLATERA